MANLLFVKTHDDGREEEIEVPEQYVSEARRDPTLMEAAEFKRGDQSVVVKKRDFGTAIKEGLKPVQDVSFLSAIGRGAKSGIETIAAASGYSAKDLEEIGSSAAEEMAFAQEPVAYGIGKTLGIAVPAVAGVKGAILGGRPVVRAAKPSPATRQKLAAAKEGFEAEFKATNEGIGPLQRVAKGVKGTAEALRSYQATGRTQRAVAKFGGGGGPGGIDFVNLIDPGETEDKKYIAGRAATIAPGRYKSEDLNRLFSMGTDERNKARQFNQLKEAEKFVPELQRLFDGLEEGKGATFRALQERASKQFWPAFANDAIASLNLEQSRINKLPKPPVLVRNAIDEAKDIINNGLAVDPRAPVTANKRWSQVSNAEKFFRVDQARRVIDKYLSDADNPDMQRQGQGIIF
jgi:hypothetical protein